MHARCRTHPGPPSRSACRARTAPSTHPLVVIVSQTQTSVPTLGTDKQTPAPNLGMEQQTPVFQLVMDKSIPVPNLGMVAQTPLRSDSGSTHTTGLGPWCKVRASRATRNSTHPRLISTLCSTLWWLVHPQLSILLHHPKYHQDLNGTILLLLELEG